MFIAGFLLGFFIGALIGALIVALAVAADMEVSDSDLHRAAERAFGRSDHDRTHR